MMGTFATALGVCFHLRGSAWGRGHPGLLDGASFVALLIYGMMFR
jgi:hypothetical protein